MVDTIPETRHDAFQLDYQGIGNIKINVAVIGPPGSGIRGFIDRIGRATGTAHEHWVDPHDTFEYYSVPILRDGVPVQAKLIPCSPRGYPDDRNLRPSFSQFGQELVRDSDACVFMYGCTTSSGLTYIEAIWHELVINQRAHNPNVGICQNFWVVVNKIDVPRSEWTVSSVEGDRFSNSAGATFGMISARTGGGTLQLGREIASKVLDSRRSHQDA